MAPPYIDLHLHTDFSMLDGLGKPKDYVAEAKRQKKPALGITDHGNLSGAYEFYMACKEAGIRPIIGEEFYFVPNADRAKEKKKDKDDVTEKSKDRFHVVILARNAEGYRTLTELSNESHRHFHYKPLLDRRMCEALAYEEAENLVVLSGCAGSIISQKALGGVKGSARDELQWWRETFPNFYMELQHHDTEDDRLLNQRLLKMAREHEIPWVITNDSHFVQEDECDAHDALLAVQTVAKIEDEDRFRFKGEGYWLKTRSEMIEAFGDYRSTVWKQGITNTAVIAKDIDLKIKEWDSKSWHIPKYRKVPAKRTAHEMLTHLTKQGLRDRDLMSNRTYRARAKWELEQIATIEGFADFLLITREIIQWAVRNDIWVGPGRGSTAGSLVGYLVGVHKVDSIRYKLLFERFLNPARPKMPDIDTDFSQLRRPEVIEHIKEEYGYENVLPVAAFQTMKVRGAFRKLASAMGMPFADINKFTNIMFEAWGSEDDDEDEEDHIRIENLPEELLEGYPELVEMMEKVIGTKSALSRHPAGVIIFDPEDPIRELVPHMWLVASKQFTAQFDLKSAEKMGLMKQDILGLRTGDTIQQATKLVKQRTGEELDPDEWIPDEEDGDKEVYKMMAEGRNAGVFQLEGGTMFKGIQEVRPHRFEDIVVTTSIYRKGPMMAGSPSRYLANRKAKVVKVTHPSLKPILKDTWGEMAYQEQLMQIASDCAGFDQGLVADLLAAVRFKDPKMMAPLKEKFIKGMKRKVGATTEEAEKVWLTMEKQAEYLFNRSHAAAYSLITYQSARLKRWWPLEYWTALMRTVEPKNDNDKKKRQAYLAEATDHGVKILPPDILKSDVRMSCGGDVEWDNPDNEAWMRFGFEDIKGIGDKTAAKIVQARIDNLVVFKTVDDVNRVLPPGLVNTLNEAGALESIGGKKAKPHVLEEMLGWQFHDIMAPYRIKYRKHIRLPGRNKYVTIMGELIEKNRKKTKAGKPYETWRIRWTPSEIFAITLWSDAEAVWDIPKGSIIMVEGRFEKEWNNVSVGDPDQVRVIKTPRRKEAA